MTARFLNHRPRSVVVRVKPAESAPWAIALGLAVAALLFVVGDVVVRVVEANLGVRLATLLVPGVGPVRLSDGTQFTLWAGTARQHAFDVQAVCSIGPYVAAVLLVAAGLVLFPGRLTTRKIGRCTALAVGLLFAANILRLVVIIASVRLVGVQDGLTIGHHLIGTLMMLAAFVSVAVMFVRLLRQAAPAAQTDTTCAEQAAR